VRTARPAAGASERLPSGVRAQHAPPIAATNSPCCGRTVGEGASGWASPLNDDRHPPASSVLLVGIRYNTAMASISIRNSGAASAETATSVCAGIFFPKNSSRIGP
jgi:hypothetical protein